MRELAAELVSTNEQIDAWEAPIKVMTGGYTSEQAIAWEGKIPETNPEAPATPSEAIDAFETI